MDYSKSSIKTLIPSPYSLNFLGVGTTGEEDNIEENLENVDKVIDNIL